MAIEWFYSHDKQRVVGPCSSAELRKLAAVGQLLPTDMVRGGRIVDPVRARRIKGLFDRPRP